MGWLTEEKNGFIVYRCSELNDSFVTQAFSTRSFGNMALHTGDMPGQVIKNRQYFLTSIGLDLDHIIAGEQVHGTGVRVVEKDQIGSGAYSAGSAFPENDALITKDRGVILSIFTADCQPIFLYDPVTPAVAIVHAGWRGTIARILKVTLDTMKQHFNTHPEDCKVAIGPAICTGCFKTNPDVAEKFMALNPNVVLKENSNYSVDLCGFNVDLLREAGVKAEMIQVSNGCTSCRSKDFFSYRAEGGTMGRMMGIIALQ